MRRRLHFEDEEACRKSIGNNNNSGSIVNTIPNVRTPAGLMDSETTSTSHADSYTISDQEQVVNFSHHSSASWLSFCSLENLVTHTDTFVPDNKSYSIPSGIGLHLNSIGVAAGVHCVSNSQVARQDYFNSGENLQSCSERPISKDSEGRLIPYEKLRCTAQDACRLEEFSQMSPKLKRQVAL